MSLLPPAQTQDTYSRGLALVLRLYSVLEAPQSTVRSGQVETLAQRRLPVEKYTLPYLTLDCLSASCPCVVRARAPMELLLQLHSGISWRHVCTADAGLQRTTPPSTEGCSELSAPPARVSYVRLPPTARAQATAASNAVSKVPR